MAEINFLPIPGDDKIQYWLDLILKEVKLEDRLVKQIFYTMLSMYTNDPRNLAINSPTGEGKNYVIRKVADIFPKEDVIKFVGMSDKSLFHKTGKLVIKNESGEYESIEEKIDEIDSKIEDKGNEIETTQNRDLKRALKGEIRELEREKKYLYKDAKKLIDLSHKTIFFLDTPRQELLNAIMSLLSHDEYEVEYEYVDTHNGIKTRGNVLRGWPVVIFAQAVDYSNSKRYPEIQRRFVITNPRMDQQKYAAAIDLTIEKYCKPDFMYHELVVSDEQKEQAREIVNGLKESIIDISSAIQPGKNNVFIPFEKLIRENWGSNSANSNTGTTKITKASDMTIADRICGYVTLLAQVNTQKRPIILFRKRGQAVTQKIPLATFEDLKEALFLMQNANGVRPYILEWFNEVFLAAYKQKTEPDFKEVKSGYVISENRRAVTTSELAQAAFNISHKKLSSRQIRETYLFPLINEGYVDAQSSQIDKRSDIYFPVIGIEQTDGIKIGEFTAFAQSPIIELLSAIRASILALLEIERQDTIVETKNIDDLMEYYKDAEKYFNLEKPEDSRDITSEVGTDIISNEGKKNNFFSGGNCDVSSTELDLTTLRQKEPKKVD